MKELARYIKILGDANRLTIIKAIDRNSLSVTEIIKYTGLSQTLVSFHLRAMRQAGIVQTRRQGPFIYYSLTSAELFDILVNLSVIAGFADSFDGPEASLKIAKGG